MDIMLLSGELEGNSMGAITTAIKAAITDLSAQAVPIITAAIGLGILFWGGKFLWTKFKGMAK